jgi:hypothetical protein
MPLTEKGSKIKSAMEEQYGPEKGERVFYASRNAGTISGVDAMPAKHPFGAEDPVTKNESISGDQEYPTHERPLDPEPETEHPQEHPGESTPPENSSPGEDCADDLGMSNPLTDQATAMPSSPPPAPASGFDALAGDIGGAITGGAMPQGWGEGWRGPTSDGPTGDALATEYSLADILREGAKHWDQWTERPLGPDQK